jgi:hypothetical protein
LGYSLNTVRSIKCDGVQFVIYSNDPPCTWLLRRDGSDRDLLSTGDVALADRKDAIRPGDAKRADVRKILDAAAEHFDDLVALWEKIHGKA